MGGTTKGRPENGSQRCRQPQPCRRPSRHTIVIQPHPLETVPLCRCAAVPAHTPVGRSRSILRTRELGEGGGVWTGQGGPGRAVTDEVRRAGRIDAASCGSRARPCGWQRLAFRPVTPPGQAWHGVVWCGVAWCGVVWRGQLDNGAHACRRRAGQRTAHSAHHAAAAWSLPAHAALHAAFPPCPQPAALNRGGAHAPAVGGVWQPGRTGV